MAEQEQNKSTALRELIEKGRKNSKLNYNEVIETLEDLGYTGDAIDKFKVYPMLSVRLTRRLF